MIEGVGALAVFAIVGLPIARLLHPSGPLELRVGSAILFGSAAAAASLTILSAVGIPWSRGALLLLLLGVAGLSTAVRFRRNEAPHQRFRVTGASAVLDLVTAALLLVYTVRALQPAMWSWDLGLPSRRDFFFIWGMKAKLFFELRGIDLSFLRAMPDDLSHRDYPLLLPLIYDAFAVFSGKWDERICAVASIFLAVGLLLVVRGFFRASGYGATAVSTASLALSGAALLPWVGFAEGPLVAYAGSGVLMLALAARGDSRHLLSGALLLGLATQVKNEGLTYALAAAVAFAVAARPGARLLAWKLWPIAAIALPWEVTKRILGMQTDLFRGDPWSRIGENLAALPEAFATTPPHNSLFLAAAVLALALAARNGRRIERFLLMTVAFQFTFYVVAYLVTPLGVEYHVLSSWPRLSSHLALPLGTAALCAVFTEPEPEAGSRREPPKPAESEAAG